MLLKTQKSISNVILFWGEGGRNFLRYVRLYIFVTLNLSRGVLREIWQMSLNMQVFFIPAHGETSLYLTNYVEYFVQVLHKHFRGGGGYRPMLILLI